MEQVGDWKVKALANQQRKLTIHLSGFLPREEMYSLTDQLRRSCRSVCANIAEAYAKRRYPAHMVSKLTDADGENAETRVWLEAILECGYISTNDIDPVLNLNTQINRLLNYMMIHRERFALKTDPKGK
jgi:four helix bundle protein